MAFIGRLGYKQNEMKKEEEEGPSSHAPPSHGTNWTTWWWMNPPSRASKRCCGQPGTAKLTKLRTHIHCANARQLDAAMYSYRNRNRKTPSSPAPSLTGTNYLTQAASTEAFKRKIPLCSAIFFFLFFFLFFVHRLSTPEWGWILCVWPLFIQPCNINTCSFSLFPVAFMRY